MVGRMLHVQVTTGEGGFTIVRCDDTLRNVIWHGTSGYTRDIVHRFFLHMHGFYTLVGNHIACLSGKHTTCLSYIKCRAAHFQTMHVHNKYTCCLWYRNVRTRSETGCYVLDVASDLVQHAVGSNTRTPDQEGHVDVRFIRMLLGCAHAPLQEESTPTHSE